MSSHRTRKGNSSESRVARTQRSSDGDHSGPYGLRSKGKRISVDELFGSQTSSDRRSWADRSCDPEDEDNQSVSTPMKNLSMSGNTPRKTTGVKRERDPSPNSPSVMNNVRRRLGLAVPIKEESGDMRSAEETRSLQKSIKQEPQSPNGVALSGSMGSPKVPQQRSIKRELQSPNGSAASGSMGSPKVPQQRSIKREPQSPNGVAAVKDESGNMGSPKYPPRRMKRERDFSQSPKGLTLQDLRMKLSRRNSNNDNDNASTSSSMYSSDTEDGSERNQKQLETDPGVLARRQKQIDYGKNTKGYKLYLKQVPKNKREPHHIFTPKKHIKYSRRSWDTQIKMWRKRLHEFDPELESEDEDVEVDLGEVEGLI